MVISTVALGKIFVQIVFDFRKGWEIFAGSAEFYNALLDIFGGDAERISFSGCVNIGENHMVCQGKSGGEIIEQRFGSACTGAAESAQQSVLALTFPQNRRNAATARRKVTHCMGSAWCLAL